MLRYLFRAGLLCLFGVALIRSAEHFQVLPTMGWGPDSPAHYMALMSVGLGASLLLAGFVYWGWQRSRRRRAILRR